MRQTVAFTWRYDNPIIAPTQDSTNGEYMDQPLHLTIRWHIRLSAALAARIEDALWDHRLRKPKFGSRRRLIEHLLEEWLKAQAEEQPNA